MAQSQTHSFDLNQDGVVTLEEMETAVKLSFGNVKHDILELKNIQEHGLAEFNKLRKDLDEFVHRDDFSGHSQQIKDFVLSLDRKLHAKEEKLLKHMSVLEQRMSRLSSLIMEDADLRARVQGIEGNHEQLQEVMDLSHLNKELHDEILKLSSDLLSLKHLVREELQDKVHEIEKHLAGIANKDQYDSQVFITRKDIEELSGELEKQRSLQANRLTAQIRALQKRFIDVESLLHEKEKMESQLTELRANLTSAQEILEVGKDTFARKDEVKELKQKLAQFEKHLTDRVSATVKKELSEHDEKMTDTQAFLKKRMQDLSTGTITRKDLEHALSAMAGWDQGLRDDVSKLREEVHEMRKKAKAVDEFRRDLRGMERTVEELERRKADITDVTGHTVSKHHFLKETTQLDNDLKALKDQIAQFEGALSPADAPSEKKVAELSSSLERLEKRIHAQAEFIHEIKELIDADIKDKKLY